MSWVGYSWVGYVPTALPHTNGPVTAGATGPLASEGVHTQNLRALVCAYAHAGRQPARFGKYLLWILELGDHGFRGSDARILHV